ncbi:MAG: metal ABC transporter permease [Actinomycetota bacterium]|nr:metal ABC transporter permease [Actinomycetota bacterium]
MSWLNNSMFIEPFTNNEFMRLSLAAGILVAITCAIAGTFVVLRGLAFIGDALSHGVLPGIATAMLLGVSGVIGAAVSSLVMMAGVSVVSRRFRLSGDTAIGLLFVGMLALGVMITSRSRSFVGDLSRILFGELLGVNTRDLILQLIALVIIGVVAFVARRPFLLLCVDEGLAKTSGFSSRLFHNLMLMIVAVTVIASFQTVGTLLVFGMLIAPAATGALFARRISTMIFIAALVGSVSSYVGLLVSYHFNLAAGASIVLTAVLIFAIAATYTEIRKAIADNGHNEHEHPHSHAGSHIK